MQERLDKILASQGCGSRKQVKVLLQQGAVTVNGTVVTRPETKANGEADAICVNGQPLHFQRYTYLMLHKPAGVLSAARDAKAPTVLDLIPPQHRRRGLFPAGRLDKDTEGLLLITDDGDFTHRLLSPKSGVQKIYHARLDIPVTQQDIARFAAGLVMPTLQCLPAALSGFEKNGEPWAQVTVCEGKFHQVRRMLAACGKQVLYLKRVQIGALPLDPNLPKGQVRPLTKEEQTAVFSKIP